MRKRELSDRSLFIAWGGAEDFGGGGITWFLGEKKGGSVVTETTQICLENEDKAGGSWKSSNVIRADHFTEVTFKGGIG